jgi:16S rRNA processing protein RimM
MIRREELTRIGRIKKSHGIKGELSFDFTDDSFHEGECDFLIFELDGIFVPFRLSDYRFISNTSALITLKGIDSEEDTCFLIGKEVFFPSRYIEVTLSEETFSWDYFRGFTLIDEKLGPIGQITEIDETTINVLFYIESPSSRQYFIPANDEMITHINPDRKELFIMLPDGILDL